MRIAMKLVVASVLLFMTAGNGFGQATVDQASPEAQKKARQEKKMLDGIVTKLAKKFGPAKLTKEQLTKLPELIKPKVSAVFAAKKAVDATLTKDQTDTLKKANRAAMDRGLKGKAAREAFGVALDGLGLSDKARQAYDDAKAKLAVVNQEIAGQVTEILTDEQKAAMPSKGKGNVKGKGKGKGKVKGKGEMKDKGKKNSAEK